MSKAAVIYWSGSGNTEKMAKAVANGAKKAGAKTELFTSAEFTPDMTAAYDTLAWGCPAQGDEMLEEFEFEPLFDACAEGMKDKRIGLFGSYGWGDGTWMRNWEEKCGEMGISLAAESVICNDVPDGGGLADCAALGAELVK